MHRERIVLAVLALSVVAAASTSTSPRAGAAQEVLPLEGDVSPVHDPVVIKERDTYYVFVTGGRNGQGVIPVRSSTDMRTWTMSGFVFESLPDWAMKEDPAGAQCLGARHLALQREIPPLLLGVVVRQPQLRHRSRDHSQPRSAQPGLQVGGRGHGAPLVSGEGRLERD